MLPSIGLILDRLDTHNSQLVTSIISLAIGRDIITLLSVAGLYTLNTPISSRSLISFFIKLLSCTDCPHQFSCIMHISVIVCLFDYSTNVSYFQPLQCFHFCPNSAHISTHLACRWLMRFFVLYLYRCPMGELAILLLLVQIMPIKLCCPKA